MSLGLRPLQRLVFFDLETGGLDSKRHPIIQLAAVAVDQRGEAIEAFEAKIQFDRRRANAYSLRKNHYQPGVWAVEALPQREAAHAFAAFLRRHATLPTLSASGQVGHVAQLVAHNAAFDGSFLFDWYGKQQIYPPARRLVLCTLQLAMWHFTATTKPPPANFKLATLCDYFGVPFHAAAAHEALADVSATVRLFRAIHIARFGNEPQSQLKCA
jgi:DNA polymerase III epsilon subunit-like protein